MPDPKLQWVTGTFSVCDQCLDGAGGECHTSGCLFWINRAPDIALRGTLVEIHGCSIKDECSASNAGPIANLLQEWRDRAFAQSHNSTLGRLCNELQAAIDEQIRVWDDIEGDFKCINDAFDRCISDLRGDNQGGEE